MSELTRANLSYPPAPVPLSVDSMPLEFDHPGRLALPLDAKGAVIPVILTWRGNMVPGILLKYHSLVGQIPR